MQPTQQTPHTRPDLPGLCTLRPTTRLFIRVSRALAFGLMDQADIGPAMRRSLGPSADLATAWHYSFLKLLARSVPGKLCMHTPNCPCLGQAERSLATALDAFMSGNHATGLKHLADLTDGPPATELVSHLHTLAMLYAGQDLPSPSVH